MRIKRPIFFVKRLFKKNVYNNICKLKLHMKGFYWHNLRAFYGCAKIPFLKFSVHLCVKFLPADYNFPGKIAVNCMENLKQATEEI